MKYLKGCGSFENNLRHIGLESARLGKRVEIAGENHRGSRGKLRLIDMNPPQVRREERDAAERTL